MVTVGQFMMGHFSRIAVVSFSFSECYLFLYLKSIVDLHDMLLVLDQSLSFLYVYMTHSKSVVVTCSG